MENNKDKKKTKAPVADALENEQIVQDAQVEEPGLAAEDSAKLDELIETLDVEEAKAEETAKVSLVKPGKFFSVNSF